MEAQIQTAPRPSWLQIVLIGRNPQRTLIRLLIVMAVLFATFNPLQHFKYAVLVPIRVHGISMAPTYHENQLNVISRIPYWFHEPQRGDVVAIRTSGQSIMYMKRIVGLPGETIGFHRGKVMVNGQPLYEPYLKLPSDWEEPPQTLGPDEYYVVGDNRSMAFEDHVKGKPSRRRIVGKAML
jgi:signal peptidase I